MATTTTPHIISSSSTLPFASPQKSSIFPQPPSFLNLSTTNKLLRTTLKLNKPPVNAFSTTNNSTPTTTTTTSSSNTKFYGLCYVVGDNIDTDQIIPSEFNGLNPTTNHEDYKALGLNAFVGLLPTSYAIRFNDDIDNGFRSKYSIVIAGENFGCGPSKDLAGVALNAAGTRAVVAESFDGVFVKNFLVSNNNGKLLLLGLENDGVKICKEFKTGDVATIDVGDRMLINRTTGKGFLLKNLGDAYSLS